VFLAEVFLVVLMATDLPSYGGVQNLKQAY
jgi:hypothetical protein